MNTQKKTRILAVVLALLILIAAAVWFTHRPEATAGEKALTVEVFHGDGTENDFTFQTRAENLRQACEEQGLIAGTESEYGLYVLTVDGETADETEQQWWCVTKNGEMTEYGVDETMIQDGEQYEFTLKTGW